MTEDARPGTGRGDGAPRVSPEPPSDPGTLSAPLQSPPPAVGAGAEETVVVPAIGEPSEPPASVTAEPAHGSEDPSPSTGDVAKDEAARVGGQAKETAHHVASVAAQETQSLVGEAGDRARGLLEEAQSALADQARAQQGTLASLLRTVADDLHDMVEARASRSDDENGTDDRPGQGVADRTVREASARASGAASWLEDREPNDVLDEVTDFARRRPGAFLLLAGAAGVVAGRLTRGMTGGSDE